MICSKTPSHPVPQKTKAMTTLAVTVADMLEAVSKTESESERKLHIDQTCQTAVHQSNKLQHQSQQGKDIKQELIEVEVKLAAAVGREKKKVCGRLRKEQEQLEKDLELLAISAKLEVLDLLTCSAVCCIVPSL